MINKHSNISKFMKKDISTQIKHIKKFMKKNISTHIKHIEAVNPDEILDLKKALIDMISKKMESKDKKLLNEDLRKKRFKKDIEALNKALQFLYVLENRKKNQN